MKALKILVASSVMLLFLAGEVAAFEINVKLPKTVSGEELVQIIQDEAGQIPALRVVVDSRENFTYKPGSFEQEASDYSIGFFTKACSASVVPGFAALSVFITATKNYQEINLTNWTEDYSCIKNEFDELVGRIYDRLQTP